jgi:hypothetical protein
MRLHLYVKAYSRCAALVCDLALVYSQGQVPGPGRHLPTGMDTCAKVTMPSHSVYDQLSGSLCHTLCFAVPKLAYSINQSIIV